jgi:hypothetical protein
MKTNHKWAEIIKGYNWQNFEWKPGQVLVVQTKNPKVKYFGIKGTFKKVSPMDDSVLLVDIKLPGGEPTTEEFYRSECFPLADTGVQVMMSDATPAPKKRRGRPKKVSA